MPAPYPNEQGFTLTIGILQGSEFMATVIPMVSDQPIDAATIGNDLATWIEGTLLPAWVPCLCVAQKIISYQQEGMRPGIIAPVRKNYPESAWPGTVAGEICPPTTSMLLSFYSTDQVAAEARTKVGRQFIGAPPEAKQNAGNITDPAFYTDLENLASVIAAGFNTAGGNLVQRCIGPHRAPGASELWPVTQYQARGTTFTQRRRQRPLI